MKLFLLACAGGAIGAGLRHAANTAAVKLFGLSVAWATLAVNVVGSLAMGFLVAYLFSRFPAELGTRVFLATGVLGGFTTFSAFSLDVMTLLERGQAGFAASYVALSVLLSVGACAAGLGIGRSVVG